MKVTEKMNPEKVLRASARTEKSVITRQAAYVRGVAKRSIRFRKNPELAAPPGSPPHTHNARTLKNAIRFGTDAVSAVIGPTRSRIGRIGHTHEFGGVEEATSARTRVNNWRFHVGGHGPIDIRNGDPVFGMLRSPAQVARAQSMVFKLADRGKGKPRRRYAARPFMGPALTKSQPSLPGFWRDAIRQSA